jgi:hypothetical protein
MNQITFQIHISAEQFLEYYRGSAKNVRLKMTDGKVVQFPANILQPFVQRDGVHGGFVLRFDDNHKLIDIKRCSQ